MTTDSNIECECVWRDTFYSEEYLKQVDYGAYNPANFTHSTVDGVYGAYVREGWCPTHGLICSMLGGIHNWSKPRHPCGAYAESTEVDEVKP